MKIPIKAILVVIATTFWTSAFSQLVLNKNGQLAIFPLKNTPVASFPTSNLLADTTANIIVLGNKIYYGGGKIAFGMKSEGEASIGSKSFGLLQLVGDRGMEYCSAGSKIIEPGSNVTNHKQQGRVIFRSGKYCLKTPFILIEPETYIENNVELILDN